MFSINPIPFENSKTWIDLFCGLLQNKLQYQPGERDMVIMHHILGTISKNGTKGTITSTMIAYGDPNGYSAMAKTVGLPTAIAAEMILKGNLMKGQLIQRRNSR